ncbi:MAG: polyhydroxyalkanoic acid system family protein [Bdellovibrionales bacterium]|nr:polyhydroxyalkanoic acid system family protein [Bdellovibrionales bacterium]
MPKIKVERNTKLSPEDAFERVQNLLENDSELKKLDQDMSFEFNKNQLEGSAKGKQFSALMKVSEAQGSSNVSIEVDLPFHLGLIKGVVEKTLHDKLEDALDYA